MEKRPTNFRKFFINRKCRACTGPLFRSRDKPSKCFVFNTRTKFCIWLKSYCYIDCKYRIYFLRHYFEVVGIAMKTSDTFFRDKDFLIKKLICSNRKQFGSSLLSSLGHLKDLLVCIKFSKKYLPKTFFFKFKHFIWS